MPGHQQHRFLGRGHEALVDLAQKVPVGAAQRCGRNHPHPHLVAHREQGLARFPPGREQGFHPGQHRVFPLFQQQVGNPHGDAVQHHQRMAGLSQGLGHVQRGFQGFPGRGACFPMPADAGLHVGVQGPRGGDEGHPVSRQAPGLRHGPAAFAAASTAQHQDQAGTLVSGG